MTSVYTKKSDRIIQNTNRKLNTENLNNGPIHSFYDTTILNGHNTFNSTAPHTWCAPVLAYNTGETCETIFSTTNSAGNIISMTDYSGNVAIYDATTATGMGEFDTNINDRNSIGYFGTNGGVLVTKFDQKGTVMSFAGIDSVLATGYTIISHPTDEGFYLLARVTSNINIYSAGKPPIAYSGFTVPTNNSHILMVKYDKNLQVEWASSIYADRSIVFTNHNINKSGDLIILGYYPQNAGTGNNNIYFTNPMKPIGTSFPPTTVYGTINEPLGNRYSFMAKYNNSGVLQFGNKVVSDGTGNPGGIFPDQLLVDSTGNIYISVISKNGEVYINPIITNIKLYNSAPPPNLDGTVAGTMVLQCERGQPLVVKYDASGQVLAVFTDDLYFVGHKSYIVLDKEDNLYFTYDVEVSYMTQETVVMYSARTPGSVGDPFVKGTAVGTIDVGDIFVFNNNNGHGYVNTIKYDKNGVFQWINVASSPETNILPLSDQKTTNLSSSSILILYQTQPNSNLVVFKPSFPPAGAGNFVFVEDCTISSLVNQSSLAISVDMASGNNQWIIKTENLTEVVTGHDVSGNLYIAGLQSGTIKSSHASPLPVGGGEISFSLAGEITMNNSICVFAYDPTGMVKWEQSTNIATGQAVPNNIDVSPHGVLLSLAITGNNFDIVFMSKRKALEDRTFEPEEIMGFMPVNNISGYLLNLIDILIITIHPSYTLQRSNNGNKVIYNDSKSDAEIYFSDLMSDRGVTTRKAIMGHGSSLTLVSLQDGLWSIKTTYGDVDLI